MLLTSLKPILILLILNMLPQNIPSQQMYQYDRQAIENEAFRRARNLKYFAIRNGLDTNFFFLIDFSIPSGFNRLFLVDLDRDTILFETLVSHGSGRYDDAETWDGIPTTFSNIENTNLSSLGRYIIGSRGKSMWGVGTKYILHGIDSTNDNAKDRSIVLHSWSSIPNKEIYPGKIEMSWGCPAVSDSSFQIIDGVIYYRPRAMLMEIYR